MSEYRVIKTKMKDRECLVKALNDMGYSVVEVHEVAQPLVGYQGDFRHKDDLSAHTSNPDLAAKAHVIVRRKHIPGPTNDLGFVKNGGGTYSTVVSAYDMRKHDPVWMAKLQQNYNVHADLKTAKRRGDTILSRVTQPDGSVKIRVRAR